MKILRSAVLLGNFDTNTENYGHTCKLRDQDSFANRALSVTIQAWNGEQPTSAARMLHELDLAILAGHTPAERGPAL